MRKGISMGKFYAVKNGRVPGIYISWEDCKQQVDGHTGAVYKSFKTSEEAAVFMGWTKENQIVNEQEKNAKQEILFKPDEKTIIAYVDGSYNIATKEYGYGAVIITKDGEIELYEKGIDEELALMRNVAGEIKGAEAAMRYAQEKDYKKIIIYYDYEGIAKWCQGLWKTNKEGTREYKRIYDEISKTVDIQFVKVKGHSGDKYNDMADALAKKAAGVE